MNNESLVPLFEHWVEMDATKSLIQQSLFKVAGEIILFAELFYVKTCDEIQGIPDVGISSFRQKHRLTEFAKVTENRNSVMWFIRDGVIGAGMQHFSS